MGESMNSRRVFMPRNEARNWEIRDPISIRVQSIVHQLAMYIILHKCMDIFLIVKMSYELNNKIFFFVTYIIVRSYNYLC